jgi:hypothetical protein
MSNLTRLFVNDIEVFVPPNTTVLEAAEKVGVQVRHVGETSLRLPEHPCCKIAYPLMVFMSAHNTV